MSADTVVVMTLNGDRLHLSYKRERVCKHPVIQFEFDQSGNSYPVCQSCRLSFKPRIDESSLELIGREEADD